MRDEFVDTCGLCDAPLRMGQRCACGDNWRAAQPAPAQPAIITPDVPPLDIHSAAARIWQALQGVDLRKQDPVPVIAQALADAAIQHVGAPAQPASAEPVALGSRAETKSDALGSANRAKVDAEQGWRRECDDTDAVLRMIGLDPEQCRTDGGSLNVPKIRSMLRDRAAPLAYLCPAGCGCTWRDNGDGSMSLYGPSSRSCAACETMPLSKLLPVYTAPAQPASAEQQPVANRGTPGLQDVRVERTIIDRYPEINPSNYDHEAVCALNSWGFDVVMNARPIEDAPPALHEAALRAAIDACEKYAHEIQTASNGEWGVALECARRIRALRAAIDAARRDGGEG